MSERDRTSRLQRLLLVAVLVAATAALAVGGARPEPTSWNDSSRVATVESLVDRHTFAIDESPFGQGIGGDKVFIDGAFYSHKPAVPAVLMAGVYKALQSITGLQASDQPKVFYRWITIGSSGVAYVIAVWCVFLLGRQLSLPLPMCVALAASLAGATVALPYSRAVNDHILGLGAALPLMTILAARNTDAESAPWSVWQIVASGTLVGLIYAFDVASGTPLLASILALIAYRSRSFSTVAVFALAALPWLTLHHFINYSIGGSLRPVAMVPEYFQWPGSPFADAADLTGSWNHDGVAQFLGYAARLLVGQRGFVLFNLPLWLAVVGFVILMRRRAPEWPELISLATWAVGTWIIYAALSTNYSGAAVSIRWFVPLLGAGFFVLCVFLRDYPEYSLDLLLLTAGGSLWMFRMWQRGPWSYPPTMMNWRLVAIALVSWLLCRLAAKRFNLADRR